jgi:hypothetical protein
MMLALEKRKWIKRKGLSDVSSIVHANGFAVFLSPSSANVSNGNFFQYEFFPSFRIDYFV